MDRLRPAQPPAVDHLEHRRVAERLQPALAPAARQLLDPVVGRVEERLQLGARQRPPLRAALVVGDVRRHVLVVADPARRQADPLLALGDPAIPRVARVVTEHSDRALVVAHRRVRPATGGDPALQLRRRPRPRPAAAGRLETAHHPFPAVDQRRAQPAADLLAAETCQHLVEQHRLRPQRRRAVHERQRRRARGPRPHISVSLRVAPAATSRHRTQRHQTPQSVIECIEGVITAGQTACRPCRQPARRNPTGTETPARGRSQKLPNVASDATLPSSSSVAWVCRSWCRLIFSLAVAQ